MAVYRDVSYLPARKRQCMAGVEETQPPILKSLCDLYQDGVSHLLPFLEAKDVSMLLRCGNRKLDYLIKSQLRGCTLGNPGTSHSWHSILRDSNVTRLQTLHISKVTKRLSDDLMQLLPQTLTSLSMKSVVFCAPPCERNVVLLPLLKKLVLIDTEEVIDDSTSFGSPSYHWICAQLRHATCLSKLVYLPKRGTSRVLSDAHRQGYKDVACLMPSIIQSLKTYTSIFNQIRKWPPAITSIHPVIEKLLGNIPWFVIPNTITALSLSWHAGHNTVLIASLLEKAPTSLLKLSLHNSDRWIETETLQTCARFTQLQSLTMYDVHLQFDDTYTPNRWPLSPSLTLLSASFADAPEIWPILPKTIQFVDKPHRILENDQWAHYAPSIDGHLTTCR
jgi:hypothetical protein